MVSRAMASIACLPPMRVLLPQATRLETLNLCTNPHACDIDGVSFIGSSGTAHATRHTPHATRHTPLDTRHTTSDTRLVS